MEVLERVQRRAVMMVSNLQGKSYEERLAELDMVTLETRRRRGDMIQTFKIMSGTDDVRPETWFTLGNTVEREGAAHTRSTTNNYTIKESRANTDIRKNFFSLRVIKPWNNLPDHVKSASTVNSFKNAYDDWLSYQ